MNVLKRLGVVFILYPILILCLVLHVLFILTCVIWGPIYYIITGEDPTDDEDLTIFFITLGESINDWFRTKFKIDG